MKHYLSVLSLPDGADPEPSLLALRAMLVGIPLEVTPGATVPIRPTLIDGRHLWLVHSIANNTYEPPPAA